MTFVHFCTLLQSAAIGGAAHLVNFRGTSTIAALVSCRYYWHIVDMHAILFHPCITALFFSSYYRDYYGTRMAGRCIPSAEHRYILNWETLAQ